MLISTMTGKLSHIEAQAAEGGLSPDRFRISRFMRSTLIRGWTRSATLTCIQENTGITTEVLRRALPAATEPICSLNTTQLGKLLNRSPKTTNQLLASSGLQFRNDRDEWELTKAGEAWAEAMPYSRNGHSGYQILWNPAVAERLKEVA